jgi:general secretion pathway protein K
LRKHRKICPGNPARDDGGWALLTVLWVVTALALLAAASEALTSGTYRMERRALDRNFVDSSLDAGVVRAVLGIEAPDMSDRWRVDGVPRQFEFNGLNLTISIQDELGRFDLNAIDTSVLSALLRAAKVPQEQVDTLADRILDWRDPSNLHRLHGATNEDYAAAGLDYHPRHGPFQSVDELRLVLGMTPEIFERIRPALTVYTKNPMIDPTHAPREALLALYAGNETVVDNVLNARNSGTNGFIGIADPSISLAGRSFSITVDTDYKSRHYERYTVVMLTGDEKRPYITFAWR